DRVGREPVASFAALVLRIAHNLAVDRIRRRDWRAERTDPDDLSSLSFQTPADAVELGRGPRAVGDPPPDLPEGVELRYVDGRSFSEIAAELSMSKNGVFARHQRALDALRRALSPYGRPPPSSGSRES